LQAFDLIHGLVEQPSILSEFGYSAEQAASTVQQLGRFAGTEGLQHCAADDIALRLAADMRPRIQEEAPFMVPLLFLLISRQFPVLAVTERLTRARFGFWSADRRTFFPEIRGEGVGFGVRWGVQTERVQDLGCVHVSFIGPLIDAIRFEEPWPAARFREGKHFMDDRFMLPLAEGSTTVFQTTASSDGLAWAKPHWYRYFGDGVAGELETTIDGRFALLKRVYLCNLSSSGIMLPLRTIRQRREFSSESRLSRSGSMRAHSSMCADGIVFHSAFWRVARLTRQQNLFIAL
jgi:hypothetical protein